jgi:hypothetical protein
MWLWLRAIVRPKTHAMKLSNATLRDLPDPILRPSYDRSSLTKVAKAARDHPYAWLGQCQFYGNLIDEPRFAGAFEGWLQMIWADGLSASLNKYLYGYH